MASSISSSSSPNYPYPSTINASNFVSIKLSKNNYSLWKAQMNCLIVSQDLVGFIDGSISKPAEPDPSHLTNQDYLIWRRTDHLLKGWILGSLSEEVLASVIHLETAKHVWANLQEKLGPDVTLDQKQSPLVAIEERDSKKYTPLYNAALKGDWIYAKRLIKKDDEVLSAKVTKSSEILHIAVGAGRKAIYFVKELVKKMSKNELSLQGNEGDTALSVAAITGNTEAAKMLVNQNPDLLYIADNDGRLPIHLAAKHANKDTLLYLLRVTEKDVVFDDKNGIMLLVDLIESGFIDMALASVKRYPRLATIVQDKGDPPLTAIARKASLFKTRNLLDPVEELIYSCLPVKSVNYFSNPNGGDTVVKSTQRSSFTSCLISVWKRLHILLSEVTGLLVPEVHNIRQKKSVYYQAIELVETLCKEIMYSKILEPEKYRILREALHLAASLGIREVVEVITFIYPDAIWFTDENNCNVFQLAIIHRQENVFNLIYSISGQQRYLISLKDLSKNNILHLAGKLAPRNKLELIPGPVLQMQRELQWFKEVEKFVNCTQKNEQNCFGQTPSMVRSAEHKELVAEGQNWLKGMANSATSILISTIIFAATFSLPGDSNGDDYRLQNSTKRIVLRIFVFSDAITLFASTTSLVVFLSILTARFAEDDFLIVLPKKLIIGLVSLFLSISSMIITFCATLYLEFGQKEKWEVIIPIIVLACLPVSSFLSLQFPLLVNLVHSTYGLGFLRKTTSIVHSNITKNMTRIEPHKSPSTSDQSHRPPA